MKKWPKDEIKNVLLNLVATVAGEGPYALYEARKTKLVEDAEKEIRKLVLPPYLDDLDDV